jgi:hypothetical protein
MCSGIQGRSCDEHIHLLEEAYAHKINVGIDAQRRYEAKADARFAAGPSLAEMDLGVS